MKNEEPGLAPKVHQLLKEDFVLADLQSQTREEVLQELAHLIRRSRHLSKKLTRARTSREILDIIREEEEKFS